MARAIPRATQLAWNSAKHFVVIEAGATPEMSNIGGASEIAKRTRRNAPSE